MLTIYLALAFLIVSFVWAVVNQEWRSPLLWGVWAIAAALILGSVRL